MTTKKKRSRPAREFLEDLNGGPLTLGQTLRAIRQGDGLSQRKFAEQLGVSVPHLCDVEKDRKGVSVERAARWAAALGYSERQFVRLALQGLVHAAGLQLSVHVEAA